MEKRGRQLRRNDCADDRERLSHPQSMQVSDVARFARREHQEPRAGKQEDGAESIAWGSGPALSVGSLRVARKAVRGLSFIAASNPVPAARSGRLADPSVAGLSLELRDEVDPRSCLHLSHPPHAQPFPTRQVSDFAMLVSPHGCPSRHTLQHGLVASLQAMATTGADAVRSTRVSAEVERGGGA
jgi:hypothetical protein